MAAISIGHVTRGEGKVYALIEGTGLPDGSRIVAEASLASGQRVPMRLLAYGGVLRQVLVLPLIDQDVSVVASALSAQGDVLAQTAKSFGSKQTMREGRLNTLRRDSLALSIRNYDASRPPAGMRIEIDRVIRAPRSESIMHGRVLLTGSTPDELAGSYDIALYDPSGNLASKPCVTLRDTCREHPEYPGSWVRELSFSLRFGADERDLWLWARAEGAVPSSFIRLDPGRMDGLCAAWSAHTQDAFANPRYGDSYWPSHRASADVLAIQAATKLSAEPVFSIIVPLFKTPIGFFWEMAESVLAQSYGRFELLLVNASPEDAALAQAVAKLATRDERVRVVELEGNRGIAGNTNAGIEAATGDFLCFLDHDDTIAPDALFCYARAIADDPTCDMLYCDEDHIDENGAHGYPDFKPEWDPYLLLAMNYVCHFLCVRASVVAECELAGPEMDGSQDHYLALAVGERARSVRRIPRVLYHWRIHAASTANNTEAKPYALEAGVRAVQAHLERTGQRAHAFLSERADGRYEVEWEIDGEPLVSVIIPNKDQADVLERCVRSILDHTTWQNYEIVIVENNSREQATFELYERLRAEDARVRVVTYEGEFNYPAINNLGAREAKGDYLLLLNNDTEAIEPGWMRRMLQLAQREDVGAVGAKLLYPDRTTQHCGIMMLEHFPGHMNMFHDERAGGYVETLRVLRSWSAATGACLMCSRTAWDAVGGMDEDFAVDYNDVAFCLALGQKGLRVLVDPGVVLLHYESVSRGFNVSEEQLVRFTRERAMLRERFPRESGLVDPHGNPNFNQRSGYFALG